MGGERLLGRESDPPVIKEQSGLERLSQEAYLRERIKDAKSSKEVYIKLLGLETYPETPGDLPEEVYLPSDLVGHLANTISKTGESSKESFQMIGWNRKKGRFRLGRMFNGGNFDIGIIAAEYRAIKKSLFAQRSLLEFHTHPSGSFFSVQDISSLTISSLSYFSKPAFINLVGGGSETAIYALLLSGKFDTLKSTLRRGIYNEDINPKDFNVLESYGVCVYRGKFYGQQEVLSKETKRGIVLEKFNRKALPHP